jgi:putative restriction endonuclease
MEKLDKLLNNLEPSHKSKLEWFSKNKGREVLWDEMKPKNNGLEGNPFLITNAKGIFKPAGESYALSFKQVMGSKYSDLTPIIYEDGSWIYRYKEEDGSRQEPDPKKLWTNKAAKNSMENAIPIGVAIQISEKPNPKYKILGLGIISEWVDDFFVVNGFSDVGTATLTKSYGPLGKDLEDLQEELEKKEGVKGYDPSSTKDERDKVLKTIVQRRGQKKFRNALLKIYNNTCVITECNIPAVLEASHITPYLGEKSNHPSNGLLLRADIHTLWDLGMIAINPVDMKVNIKHSIFGSVYDMFHSKKINFSEQEKPSMKALKEQWEYFNKP